MCNVCENQIVCYRVNYWFKKRSFFKYLLTCLSKISEILVELRLDYIYFVRFISLFVDRYNLCYTLGNLFELILQLNTYVRIGAIIIAGILNCSMCKRLVFSVFMSESLCVYVIDQQLPLDEHYRTQGVKQISSNNRIRYQISIFII